jgi:hypothetical protein
MPRCDYGAPLGELFENVLPKDSVVVYREMLTNGYFPLAILSSSTMLLDINGRKVKSTTDVTKSVVGFSPSYSPKEFVLVLYSSITDLF